MKLKYPLLTSSVVTALFLGGCNGGSQSSSSTETTAQVPANETPVSTVVTEPSDAIRLNQHGYAPKAKKRISVVSDSAQPLDWQLSKDGNVVMSGQSQVFGGDIASGEQIHHVDLSPLQDSGKYVLEVEGIGAHEVNVEPDLFTQLLQDSVRFYHFHRMGQPIKAEHLDNPVFAREAIHPGDSALPCFEQWCGEGVTLNVKYAWYDAGDFGAYAVNTAISAWTLLNAWEFGAVEYTDQQFNIPESGNDIPDILDEVQFGSTFMAGMLPAGNQLASHKIHNVVWSGFDGVITHENAMERYAQPPSTGATLAVARNAAHLARTFISYDTEYAQQQWQVALDTWQRAESNPVVYYTSETKDNVGGGDYDDINIVDDRYAAAAELWITATILQDQQAGYFAEQVRGSEDFLQFDADGAQQWQQVQGSGSLSLWLHRDTVSLTEEETTRLASGITATADTALERLQASGYPMVYNPSIREPEQIWPWGSNSFVLNRMMVVAYAHQISNDSRYLEALYQGMDYLLGNNPMNLSYITGYGEEFTEDLHDRIAYPMLRDQNVSFPSGWVAGGPLTGWEGCDKATPETGAPAKRYAPQGTATDAWCSKEVAINWNSPLAWISAYLVANPLN